MRDRVELGAALAHRLEQVHGARELADRVGGVAGGHEQLADPGGEHAVEQLVEVRAVAHEAGGQVRHHGVAGAHEPLAQLERGVQAAARRGGDGHRRGGAQMGEHLVLHAVERNHLEARALEQRDEAVRLALDRTLARHD